MSDYLSTEQILARLSAERAGLVARLERIPAARQNVRPTPERWSVAEVLEHLVRLEMGLTKLLALKGQAPPAADVPAPPADALGTPQFGALVRDRSKPLEAPERVRPEGKLSAEEALARLQAARAALLEAFASADAEALDRQTHVHPFFGPLTLRSWMALAADHEARHAAQIGEIADQLSAERSASV